MLSGEAAGGMGASPRGLPPAWPSSPVSASCRRPGRSLSPVQPAGYRRPGSHPESWVSHARIWM